MAIIIEVTRSRQELIIGDGGGTMHTTQTHYRISTRFHTAVFTIA